MKREDPNSRSNRMLRFVSEFTGARAFPSLDLHNVFAALQYPNYRLWFLGQMISLVGSWMQTAAQGFLIFQLTQSPAYLGYVAFATGAPSFFLMLFGGVYADRMSRKKVLLLTQTTMMVLAFVLAGLTFFQIVRAFHIVLLALFLGVANAFDAPTRHSIVPEMVDREDLPNAIALNSIMFNLGILIGPAAAGLIYVAVGPAWCFTINGLTFISFIAALTKIKLKPFVAKGGAISPLKDFKEGLHYAVSHKLIRTLLGVAAVMCLFGTVYMTLIPAWAVRVLNGDATTNGWLLSARGLGALVAAVMIASLGRFQFKGKLLTLGTFIFPVMLLIFASVRLTSFSLLIMFCVGWAFMITFNMINALIQTQVADDLRGRVISLYTFCIFGLNPIGSLLVGWEAETFGEPTALVVNAGVALFYSIWVFCRVPQLSQLK